MSAIGFSVNGTEMATLGVNLQNPGGVWDSIYRQYQTALRVGNLSSIVLSNRARSEPRPIRLTAILTAPDLATMNTRLDQAHYVLSAPEMVIESADRPTRQITVRNEGRVQVGPAGGRLGSVRFARSLTIPVSAPDPRWYDDTTSQSVSLSTSPAACPLGNAPVEPLLTGLPGTCTVSYLDPSDNPIVKDGVTLEFGWTGVASTPVTLDLANQTLIDNGGASVLGTNRDAGSVWFSLDPHDGDFLTSAWVKLALSAGTGSADYARGWEG